VKLLSADGSVGLPHARVGHCQALILKTPIGQTVGVFFCPAFGVAQAPGAALMGWGALRGSDWDGR
ncbi:hypothetical protein, partial [Ectothiorhodospira haloalkaliphila]|uniref:hypothetical protein n=1 Tax=Ectothiorhodospira haloalkaliphila TaxID=421628 RepID=UPI003AF9B7B9